MPKYIDGQLGGDQLIVKAHPASVYIQKFEALLRRLPASHSKRKRVEENLAKRMAGDRGEKAIDFHLSYLNEKDYYIFYDIRLFDGSHYFQIDTLILSKRFIVILEVKNIMGKLYFDSDFNQLIRTLDEKEEPFPDPILQVERQSLQFKKWLGRHIKKYIPIETLVVISTSRAILQTNPQNENIYQKVLLSTKLPLKIDSFNRNHQKELISTKQLEKISENILEGDTPLEIDVLEHLKISKNELLRGVQCAKCSLISMYRIRGKWKCSECHFISKDAHIQSLIDYSLLFETSITNKKMREFLNLESSNISKKILASLNLTHLGNTKDRFYNLSNLQKKHPQ